MANSIQVDFEGIGALQGEFPALARRLGAVPARTVARARRDLLRLYKKHLQAEIAATTSRRTGTLYRSPKPRVLDLAAHKGFVLFRPDFPRTAYATPFGRGRPGAAKRGQYAFVVNSRRQFIQRANAAMARDPQVNVIIRKHSTFIISSILGTVGDSNP